MINEVQYEEIKVTWQNIQSNDRKKKHTCGGPQATPVYQDS